MFRRNSWGLWIVGVFLLSIAPSGARALLDGVASKRSPAEAGQEHALRLYNTHTGERMEIIYRRGDQYVPEALSKLDYFLRDHRSGDVRHFDPRLYDILSDLTASVGQPGAEIDIVCGYRTPSTNETLRASPRTAYTFRRKPLICACQGSIRSSYVRRLWLCTAAEWAIILTRISYTSM